MHRAVLATAEIHYLWRSRFVAGYSGADYELLVERFPPAVVDEGEKAVAVEGFQRFVGGVG